MYISSNAVVLRTIPFSDTSLICRLFTKEKGKISIMAKGARRKKNPLSSILESGNIIKLQYLFKENRDIQILKEASLDSNLQIIRNNLDKILTLYAVVDIMDKTTHPLNESPILFRLIKRTLESLSCKKNQSKILYNFYLLHLTIQNGFRPNLDHCYKCHDILKNFNFLLNGELICSNCNNIKLNKIIDLESIFFIKKLMVTNIEKLNTLDINNINFIAISLFLEEYMRYHIEGMSSVKSTTILHKVIS